MQGSKIPVSNPLTITLLGGDPRDVLVKAVNSGIVVSKFELQSRY